MLESKADLATLRGGCHCGAVRYMLESPRVFTALDCNCSICRMSGFLHLIVPRAKFELQSGEAALVTYRFGTGVAQHRFCGRCGVKSFYLPRSNPEGIDVNVRCLDPDQDLDVSVERFDGQHWEEHAAALAHLSR